MLEGNLEYALTRVQAHYGRRLHAGDWHRLEMTQDPAQYLGLVRASMFAGWVASLDVNRDVHAAERVLRDGWRRYVRAVAIWHPRKWQAWIGWLEWLPTLSLIAALARPEAAPPWLSADPICGAVASAGPGERIAALPGTALADFEPAIAGRVTVVEFWISRWRELRPLADAHSRRLIEAAVRLLRDHRRSLCAESANTAALRHELHERLTGLFRAATGTVAATFCHLMLIALDFERLRGGFVSRRLFAAARAS